jgi:hypothetical protein
MVAISDVWGESPAALWRTASFVQRLLHSLHSPLPSGKNYRYLAPDGVRGPVTPSQVSVPVTRVSSLCLNPSLRAP